jgi:hypothetical protein
MFLRDHIVKIRHGAKDRYVQVESGPFKLAANAHGQHYQGWILLEKGDPYGEPSTVCFAETEAILATEDEVAANTQGRIDFREASF